MTALPDAMFVIDVGYHKIAVTEAKKLGIPIVAVVDTNHSPIGIAYVIPGNDDSSRAIRLYARGVADAVLEGKSQVDPGDRRRRATNSSKSRTTPRPDAQLPGAAAAERACPPVAAASGRSNRGAAIRTQRDDGASTWRKSPRAW